MAGSMSNVLKHVKLDSYLGIFGEQKISPDIVCKLSMYDFQCLGIVNRSDIMRLRIECVKFGSCQPDLISNHHLGRHEFSILKLLLKGFSKQGLQFWISVTHCLFQKLLYIEE